MASETRTATRIVAWYDEIVLLPEGRVPLPLSQAVGTQAWGRRQGPGREESRDGVGDEDGDKDRRVVRRGGPRWVVVGRWGRRRGPMPLSWQDFAGFASEVATR